MRDFPQVCAIRVIAYLDSQTCRTKIVVRSLHCGSYPELQAPISFAAVRFVHSALGWVLLPGTHQLRLLSTAICGLRHPRLLWSESSRGTAGSCPVGTETDGYEVRGLLGGTVLGPFWRYRTRSEIDGYEVRGRLEGTVLGPFWRYRTRSATAGF